MKNLSNLFVANKKPISLLLFAILCAGTFAYSRLETSLFPEITFPKIKIIADAGLQPVNKMMVTVTKPLEEAIKRVPNLTYVRSTTSRGSCEISAFMNWNADINFSQQRIESRIAEIKNNLPPDVNITVEQMNPSILPVAGYTLESQERSAIELKQLATYTVKPFLSQVAGVAEIRVIGGKTKEYWLVLNRQKMSALHITPDAITIALSQTAFVKSNGYLSDYKLLYLTVTDASVNTSEQLQNLIVSNDGKRILQLKDIADIQINPGIEYTKVNANGHEGVLIAVIKQPASNLVDLSAAMQNKVTELQRLLPKGVTIKPYYVQADFVNESIRSVKDSLWIGLALAIIVAIIFLRSLKASTTILLTIPVTLGLTLILIYAVGYSLNIMTLGAIAAAIGLIIDDAIVVVEQIHRTHEENPDEPTLSILQKAIGYLLPAMVGSSASTIVIFIPFLLMTGVAGAYFKVMTNTMIITLICSFLVTWIGLPVIYLLLSRKSKPSSLQKNVTANIVKKQPWVSYFIVNPVVSILIMVLLVAVIWFIPSRLQTGFLPDMDEGSIVLDYTSPPGTSLEETDRMLREIEKLIIKEPDVEAYSRRTGTQMGFFITEPNTGDYLIQLKRGHKKTSEAVITDLRSQIEATQPALRIDFGQVIGDMLGDLMTSTQPIEIKVFGSDQSTLQQISKQIAEVVGTVKGTADVFDGNVIAGPALDIMPNYTQLAQFKLTPAALQLQVQSALEGSIVGSLFEKEQQSPIRMVYPGNRVQDVAGMKDLSVVLPDGRMIPMTQLARVELHAGDAEIQRENLQSMGVISARLEGSDLGTVIPAIQKAVAEKINLPTGYHIAYGGAYAEQQQSFKELLLILVSASLLVFTVILFLFKQIRIALLILVLAVLGTGGSLLALYLTATPLNVGSYTGLIMIVGIIAENAIFTFWQFRHNAAQSTIEDAIVFSISTRLRPKLMTAFGAIVALSPLAFGLGSGAQLHQPLAIAVIGGFLAALPLLLIVLPSMINVLYKNHVFEYPQEH